MCVFICLGMVYICSHTLCQSLLDLKMPSVAKILCPVLFGPFKVVEKIGRSAYQLKLPERCLIQDVVHICKLWKNNKFVIEHLNMPSPLWLEGDDMPEL